MGQKIADYVKFYGEMKANRRGIVCFCESLVTLSSSTLRVLEEYQMKLLDLVFDVRLPRKFTWTDASEGVL